MPRNTRKKDKSERHEKGNAKCTRMNPMADNVNQNHSATSSKGRNSNLRNEVPKNSQNKSKQVKSKVIVPVKTAKPKEVDVTEFEEDGKIIQMEIDDGGAAAKEFASDNETGSDGIESGESEPDSETYETDDDHEILNESGEIVSDTETSKEDQRLVINAEQFAERLKNAAKRKCRSVEDRLDTMSSTLLAMKELLVKNRICVDANNSPQPRTSGDKYAKTGAVKAKRGKSVVQGVNDLP